MRTYLCVLSLLFILNSCKNKESIIDPKSLDFKSTWTLEQVLANDHWGGSLYWRNTDFVKQIKFTIDEKYYERTDADFQLIGTFKRVSDKKIEITWDKAINSQYPTYQLDYEFDNEGGLILFNGQFEGIVAEKYKRM